MNEILVTVHVINLTGETVLEKMYKTQPILRNELANDLSNKLCIPEELL